jgi:error-prone DNA polymerase
LAIAGGGAPVSLVLLGGDEVRHGGSGLDPRETPRRGLRTRNIYVPDLHIDSIKVKMRDFR